MWKQNSNFSQEFLYQHHDIVLWVIWNQIRALMLYPLNCGCSSQCQCGSFRAKIILSLNLEVFHKAQEKNNDPEFIAAIRHLLRIPEDSFLKIHFTQSYPLWLIEENFQKKEQDFRVVDRLVWTLLRLVKTYETAKFSGTYTSVNEAIDLILGKTPLKTKAREFQKEDYLCGEKEYRKQFNIYKPLSHFIAAYEFMRDEDDKVDFCIDTPEQIEKLLNLSHWLRAKLLSIQTPNVKQSALFVEEILLPLPVWFKSNQVNISVEPIAEKLQALMNKRII